MATPPINTLFDPKLVELNKVQLNTIHPELIPVTHTTTVVDPLGEKWDIVMPADVSASATNDANGLHIKFTMNYTTVDLFDSAAHGIESILITPEINKAASVNGLKADISFQVTNDLPVTMGGFLWYLVDNQPVIPPGVLDKTTFHPTNYAHFHNVPATAFAPETVSIATPDFQMVPITVTPPTQPIAPSNIQAQGALTSGQTVTASGITLHQEEIADHDNGFTLNFMPLGDPNPAKPVISGLAPSEIAATPSGTPFAGVTVTDASLLPIDSAIITIKDAAGIATDAAGVLATGVTKTGVGTYSVTAAYPANLSVALQAITFTPINGAAGSFTLAVNNGASTTTATESFTVPPTTLITTDGPALSVNGVSWTISHGQVLENGAIDAVTKRVVAIESDKGRVYQENADKQWWSKALPTDQWVAGAPPDGTADPLLHVSADNTLLDNELQTIVDTGNHTWSLVGGQVWEDGHLDAVTHNVIALAYEKGKVWQENADHLWWGKTLPADPWAPDGGTSVSPLTLPTEAVAVARSGSTTNGSTTNSSTPVTGNLIAATGSGTATAMSFLTDPSQSPGYPGAEGMVIGQDSAAGSFDLASMFAGASSDTLPSLPHWGAADPSLLPSSSMAGLLASLSHPAPMLFATA